MIFAAFLCGQFFAFKTAFFATFLRFFMCFIIETVIEESRVSEKRAVLNIFAYGRIRSGK